MAHVHLNSGVRMAPEPNIKEKSIVSTMDEERRVLQLEDIEAIRRLKCEYAKALDKMVNDAGPSHAVIDCFAPDAVWEADHFGRYQGSEGLNDLLDTYNRKVSFVLHFVLGQVITVAQDRSSATGYWTTWEPMTFEGKAMLLAGHYQDVYMRRDERWKIASSKLNVKFLTDYKVGWAEQRVSGNWHWQA
jgi:hypothetical protein